MTRSGPWLRVFLGLLLAVLVPLLLLVGVLLLSGSILQRFSAGVLASLIVAAAVGWAAMLAVIYSRALGDEYQSLLSLARQGDQGDEADPGSAYRRMATSLEERNRQVSTLAEQSNRIPIDDAPMQVVSALVSAVRSVMRDPTWRCAVLASDAADLLPRGVYHGAEESRPQEPIGDLEQWAAASADRSSATLVEGPWGAFTVVSLGMTERLTAIVYAPWEGRVRPSRAEIGLLTLVGQHAGTALEHSLLYARVRRQADELNRLAAVQADFLRGVTHDLQTPLTSIGALAGELRADGEIPERARADLDAITHQADRLRRMVSQLLVASRLEAGVLTPQQEVFGVAPIVERTWDTLRADRPFALVVEGPPYLATADPDRLEQVLWAVLDNAVKYSPPGSPIEVRITPDGDALNLTVRDEGAGMDDDALAHAFDQFYRSEQARRLAPDGSGVGLYAAQGLMKAMGGSIAVSSALGAGTAVTLRVPAEPSAEASD